MTRMTFEVAKAKAILSDGQDLIQLYVDTPTTHPEMEYETILEIKTRQGYSLEWCEKVGITLDEVIRYD